MAFQHSSPAYLLGAERNVLNSAIAQAPVLPLFSVPPPPLPPALPTPLPLFLTPPTFPPYCNVSNSSSLPLSSNNFNVASDTSMSMSGSMSSFQFHNTDENSQLHKKSDDIWLKEWLARKNKPQFSKRKKTSVCVKVHLARQNLRDIITRLNELKLVQHQMEKGLNSMDAGSWDSVLNSVKQKAIDFEASLSKFENPSVVQELKRHLMKRAKKRQSQKRRRMLQRELLSEARGRRQQLHRSIDGWLKDMQGAVEKTKVDESLKEEADTILSEVTRKKTEARRQLALLSSLLKLHQLRVKTATSKGERISAEYGVRFCKVSDHLRKLWEKQLKEYNLEEQGLRVMLNEAVDERDHSRVLHEKQNLKQWERLLFGDTQGNIDFYKAAENDLEAFINIRCDWDKFITSSAAPMSSAIPIGWVLPTVPSSAQWETVLSSNHSMDENLCMY